MANWTVSTTTQSIASGASVSADVVLTITPLSGYVISASQFKIGGATNTSGNIWEGGNVDIGVNTVTFADTGTAGMSKTNFVGGRPFSSGYIRFENFRGGTSGKYINEKIIGCTITLDT